MKDPLAIAKNVIQAEMDGLQALHDELDASFLAALEMIESTSGRIIVSGMGKSGLIGRKIAATFASTGTPAIYVHPGEASHGDLGMIVPSDIILALSKSGETSELGDLIGYAARFSIPIIAVTQERTSTLATASEVVLSLPDVHRSLYADGCSHHIDHGDARSGGCPGNRTVATSRSYRQSISGISSRGAIGSGIETGCQRDASQKRSRAVSSGSGRCFVRCRNSGLGKTAVLDALD